MTDFMVLRTVIADNHWGEAESWRMRKYIYSFTIFKYNLEVH